MTVLDAYEEFIGLRRFIRQRRSAGMFAWFEKIEHHGVPAATGEEMRQMVLATMEQMEVMLVEPSVAALVLAGAESLPPYEVTSDYLFVPAAWARFNQRVVVEGNGESIILAVCWAPILDHIATMVYLDSGDGPVLLPSGSLVIPGDWGQYPTNEWATDRILASLWAFLHEPLIAHSTGRYPREVRRAYQREEPPDSTWRVVDLRVPRARSRDDSSEAVEWSHRWVVRGHWRQQWYAKEQANRPRWIHQFVKGPPDKPLVVPKGILFRAVR